MKKDPELTVRTVTGRYVAAHIQRIRRYKSGREYVYLAWRDDTGPTRFFLGTRRGPRR